MINFLLLVSRQGKTRLSKWYEHYPTKDKARAIRYVAWRGVGVVVLLQAAAHTCPSHPPTYPPAPHESTGS